MKNDADLMWLNRPTEAELDLDDDRRVWKELIREGQWINTDAGFTLDVDGDRLRRWLANFEAMTEAGIRVPVPWGHSYDARDNAGFVETLEVRDDALWGLLHVPDAGDAEKLGRTVCGVSVSVNPNFIDGTGRRWGEVIEHVALTNYPVVTGQGEFVHAAADGEARRAITLELGTRSGVDGDEKTDERPDDEPADAETASQPRSDRPGDSGELVSRLYQLELERAEGELDDALRAGKFTRPAADALRRLIAMGVERRYAFAGRGADDGPDVLHLARAVIGNTPAGAAVDMAEHTNRNPVAPPGDRMTDDRAARLARENRKLAGV